MYIVTLAEAKKHLNIESYFTDDDSYIQTLIEVSYLTVKNFCNNNTWIDSTGYTNDYNTIPDITGTTIPLVVKQAVLLQVGDMYNVRESNTFVQSYVNKTVNLLLQPYINFNITS